MGCRVEGQAKQTSLLPPGGRVNASLGLACRPHSCPPLPGTHLPSSSCLLGPGRTSTASSSLRAHLSSVSAAACSAQAKHPGAISQFLSSGAGQEQFSCLLGGVGVGGRRSPPCLLRGSAFPCIWMTCKLPTCGIQGQESPPEMRKLPGGEEGEKTGRTGALPACLAELHFPLSSCFTACLSGTCQTESGCLLRLCAGLCPGGGDPALCPRAPSGRVPEGTRPPWGEGGPAERPARERVGGHTAACLAGPPHWPSVSIPAQASSSPAPGP